ncbi:MAG: hypothetical protein IJW55_05425 [Clostridia bacterium]|nr:hypothetical protein [Clostridia bacterium]
MTELKLLGGFLILFAGGSAAIAAVRREKKKLAVLDAWIELLSYIRGQIDLYLMPMEQILSGADKALFDILGSQAKTLTACLEASLPHLDNESRRLLTSWIKESGSTYREEELKRCDFYLASLRRRREKLAAEQPSRLKLAVALHLCLSLGTAILLW